MARAKRNLKLQTLENTCTNAMRYSEDEATADKMKEIGHFFVRSSATNTCILNRQKQTNMLNTNFLKMISKISKMDHRDG